MRAWIFAAACLAAGPASAQQPAGTATGHYVTEGGTRIELRHARAEYEDEATGGHPERGEYRILLTDRPVSEEALERSGPGSATDLAERGELLGVLIEYDLSERDEISFIELERPQGDFGPNARTLSGAPIPWRRFDFRPDRVSAELRLDPTAMAGIGPEAALSFETPVRYDPVVSVLTGAEARDSAPARAARTAHEAILAGDFETARRMATPAVAARMAAATSLNDAERAVLGSFLEALRQPARVVMRQRSAQIVMGDDSGMSLTLTMALENGEWRLAD